MCKRVWLLVLPALLLVGCASKRGFVGTWKTSTSQEDPKSNAAIAKAGLKKQGSPATMTFNADGTASFVSTNADGQEPYKLTGIGTWSNTEKEFTIVPASMKLEGLAPEKIKALQPYIDTILNKPQSGAYVWKGDDSFVLTKIDPQTKKPVDQVFKRLK